MSDRDLEHKWMPELRKVDPKENNYLYSYGDCEEAVFNKVFGKFQIIKNEVIGDWQGKTEIIIESNGKRYKCTYHWGSCSGCDTLQASGPEAACEYIESVIEEIG